MKPRTETAPVEYPDSDGKPMSDNTLQFQWIQVLTGNLAALFRNRDDVFVGGDLLWYPVHNFEKIRQAPDAFVVFGRPKGYRGSYMQWVEGDVPMTVVFEVRSPKDSDALMRRKLKFYDTYEAEEYYLLDPNVVPNTLGVYRRLGGQLGPQRLVAGCYTSPRLGIRFDTSGDEVAVYYPDGVRFLPFEEIDAERRRYQQQADEQQQRADELQQRAERQAALMRKVLAGQATPAELAELQQLLGPA